MEMPFYVTEFWMTALTHLASYNIFKTRFSQQIHKGIIVIDDLMPPSCMKPVYDINWQGRKISPTSIYTAPAIHLDIDLSVFSHPDKI